MVPAHSRSIESDTGELIDSGSIILVYFVFSEGGLTSSNIDCFRFGFFKAGEGGYGFRKLSPSTCIEPSKVL
jgi:hypothetical protein